MPKKAKPMKCHACKSDLTATHQQVTRFMGRKGERTFIQLKAPYRIEVTIMRPAIAGPKIIDTFVFCEACKDIPYDALNFVKMHRDERNPDPTSKAGSRTPFQVG